MASALLVLQVISICLSVCLLSRHNKTLLAAISSLTPLLCHSGTYTSIHPSINPAATSPHLTHLDPAAAIDIIPTIPRTPTSIVTASSCIEHCSVVFDVVSARKQSLVTTITTSSGRDHLLPLG